MRLVPEKSPLERLLVFPFGLVALSGLALVKFQPDLVLRWAHCPLRDLTGFPCPTCGGTHAAVALAAGRIGTAVSANPLVVIVLVLLGFWLLIGLIATVFPGLRRTLVLTDREKRTARVLAVLIILGTWIWEFRLVNG